ncbi:hypothetical protein JCM10450v2_008042 [Rhodotorula kratochvilovae]
MGARKGSVGLGLGLPVELDELLEAGEAFAGLGAGLSPSSPSASPPLLSSSTPPLGSSPATALPARPPRSAHRPLSAATTASTTSTSGSSHFSSPRMTGGAKDRAGRWSAASTAPTSVCDDDGRAASPPSRSVPLPGAAPLPPAPHVQTEQVVGRPRRLSSLSARSVARSEDSDLPSTPLASHSPRGPLPIPLHAHAHGPASALRTHAARQPSLSSSIGTASSSSHGPSTSSSRATLLPSYAHAHADPPPLASALRQSESVAAPHSEAWAPPEDLDDEERVVLGAMPILHPGAELFPLPESSSDAGASAGEGGWGAHAAGRWSEGELGRSTTAGALASFAPSSRVPLHPFAAQPSAPPLVAVMEPPASETRWASVSAGPSTSPNTGNKRASMLSTLASPFAGLSRSKSGSALSPPSASSIGGAGREGRRRYRLSVIGEASSPSASSRASSASAASGESTRSRASSGVGAALAALSPSYRHRGAHDPAPPPQEPHVRFSSPQGAGGALSPPSKAAKLLGLGGGSESAPARSPAHSPARRRSSLSSSFEETWAPSPDPSLDAAAAHSGAGEQTVPVASRKAAALLGVRAGEELLLSPRSAAFVQSAVRDERREEGLPGWPAKREEIAMGEVLSADIYKLTSTPTSLLRSSRTLFRPRFVALTAFSPSTSAPASYHLHAFNSRHTSERETSRLALTPASIVCAPAAAELPSRTKDRRAYAIKVTGRGTVEGEAGGAEAREDKETGWIVGIDDEGIFREWLARLKDAVRDLRGEAEPESAAAPATQRAHTPFDLDAARRAADEAVRTRSPSVSSGVGSLVLTSQGWQLEDGAARATPSPYARGRIPSAASSSWTVSSRLSGDDADASSFSGRSSVYSRGPSLRSARPSLPPAGDSFLDADSTDEDANVDEPAEPMHSDDPSPGLLSPRSSVFVPPAPSSRRTSNRSSASSRDSHLPPPLPPPAAALPPLPPLPHSSSDDPVVLQSGFNRLSLASTSSHPSSLRSAASAPATTGPPRPSRYSVLSSYSGESLPPPRPPPKGALPPVPPSPDLAQLERELARSVPYAQQARRREPDGV